MDNKIKIAIVDDHDLFREGIKLVLSQINDFEVVFDTSSGNCFLQNLNILKPDVVLMDIEMPEISGIETTQRAVEIYKPIKIIALTMFSDKTHYSKMIKAGAMGFVLKKASKTELELAVKQVYEGKNYFSQEILQQMAFSHDNTDKLLTGREKEVLVNICSGLTSNEIAEKMFISLKTVEVHRTNIFKKINVRNAAELITWAVKNNLFVIK